MPKEASEPIPKTVGKYEVVEKIAEGGMGTVYKGRDAAGQIVAIKVVAPHMTSNQVLLKRFENEFKAASKLDHPNIIRALDYGMYGDRPFLVMEYVQGESLGDRIEREGRMNEADAVRIISLAAEGLNEAHKNGMIHRDIKPDNIMVSVQGEVKLADLGLVKDVDAEMNLTRTGRGLGTPHFMAPEQFRNAKNADVRCDIYSLGATLYMMVTGELPFKQCGPLDAWMKKTKNDIPPPRKFVPELSPNVEAAIQRAMHSEASIRPANCRDFINDLKSTTSKSTAASSADLKLDSKANELWYLVYKDNKGVTHTVKGTAAGIRKSYREGVLGNPDHIRACRTKTGTFHHLRSLPEFADLFGHEATTELPTLANVTSTPPEGDAAAPRRPRSSAPVTAEIVDEVPADAGTEGNVPEWVSLLFMVFVAIAIVTMIFMLMRK